MGRASAALLVLAAIVAGCGVQATDQRAPGTGSRGSGYDYQLPPAQGAGRVPSAAVADTRLLVRSLLAGGVDREALARLDAVSSGRPSALRLRQGFALLVGWGAAVAYAREARPDVDIAGLYLAGAGIGACVAIAVQRLGVEADALGAALTVVVAGAILAFADAVPGSL